MEKAKMVEGNISILKLSDIEKEDLAYINYFINSQHLTIALADDVKFQESIDILKERNPSNEKNFSIFHFNNFVKY